MKRIFIVPIILCIFILGCETLRLTPTEDNYLKQSETQLTAGIAEQENSDLFSQADAVFDLAIGIAAIVGGLYGVKAVRFLKDAKAKSQALKEVIQNNELFKKQNPQSSAAFKHAQANQSPETRKLVTEVKA